MNTKYFKNVEKQNQIWIKLTNLKLSVKEIKYATHSIIRKKMIEKVY